MPQGFETPTLGERTFYGRFDRKNWPPCTQEDHVGAVQSHKTAKTAAEGYRIEREDGMKHLVQLATTIHIMQYERRKKDSIG